MKKLAHILTATALFATLTPALLAQQPTASPTPAAGQQQETDEAAKRRLYTCYYNNFSSNQPEAYRCSQEYIQRFGSENDQYVTAIRQFITTYEAGREVTADNAVYIAINERRYPEAFRLGKERLTAQPDNLKMMVNLAWAGLQAAVQGQTLPAETINEAISYGNRAIQQIQSGRTPAGEGAAAWAPFTSRDETLGWLNYALGALNLRTNPTEAANHLRRATQVEAAAKREPTTYSYLAVAYQSGEYDRLRQDYATRCPAGSPDTPECQAALTTLNGVIDRIMDAHARAINASNATPEFQQRYQQQRTEWTTALTELFRFRNNNSDAGLQAFITSTASRPLPQPGQAPASTTPTTPATTTTTAPATGGTATQPTTTQPTTTQPTTTTPTPNATPSPTTPATTRPATARPAPSMPTTRPATTTQPTQPATRPSSQQPSTATPRTTTRPTPSPSPTPSPTPRPRT